MTAKKLNEFSEILSQLRELEDKVKSIDVLPNWEKRVKYDLLTDLRKAQLACGDFIMSLDETVETVPIEEWLDTGLEDETEETVPFEEWLGV